MKNDKKNVTNFVRRVVTKKTGTYLIWYDAAFGIQRHINLSKAGGRKYFGTGYQR